MNSLSENPFDRLVAPDAGEFSLARAWFLLSRDFDPSADEFAVGRHLDALTARLRDRLGEAPTVAGTVEALREILVAEDGFGGNEEDYYDPRNSMMHHVLERRVGIPISLCALWMILGERVGVALQGLSLPGHFMVRAVDEAAGVEAIVDAFDGGRVLSRAEANGIISGVFGIPVNLVEEHYRPATNRAVLMRMLGNLRAIHRNKGDIGMLARVLARMVAIEPRSLPLVQEYANARRELVRMN
jgi:regulator of sirC expression with transglutaminase-like and TPR domain